MKTKLTEQGTDLEKISIGDVLGFYGREETVEKVDLREEQVYTKRDRKFGGEMREETVRYDTDGKIYFQSIGEMVSRKTKEEVLK